MSISHIIPTIMNWKHKKTYAYSELDYTWNFECMYVYMCIYMYVCKYIYSYQYKHKETHLTVRIVMVDIPQLQTVAVQSWLVKWIRPAV